MRQTVTHWYYSGFWLKYTFICGQDNRDLVESHLESFYLVFITGINLPLQNCSGFTYNLYHGDPFIGKMTSLYGNYPQEAVSL